MFEDADNRSFEELPIGTVLLRDDDGELFAKNSATEVTSFFFTSTGQRYDNDLPTAWKGIVIRWDWIVLSDEDVSQMQQEAMAHTMPVRIPWGLLWILALVMGALYVCFGG